LRRPQPGRNLVEPGPGSGVASPTGGPTLSVIGTHYDTLGVPRDARAADIRAAYVAQARRHHPDVAGGRSTSGSMADLNRAYHVLGNAQRRAAYDRELAGARTNTSDTTTSDFGADVDDEFVPPSPGSRAVTTLLAPTGPARMPWKLMGVAAVVGSLAIVASAAFTDAPQDEPPDGILRAGSCVAVETNLDVREIDCDAAEFVVRLMLPTGSTCPQPYATHRDRLGLGTACVEPIE
jgi:hypothetical protein